jgi:hypothetical protein
MVLSMVAMMAAVAMTLDCGDGNGDGEDADGGDGEDADGGDGEDADGGGDDDADDGDGHPHACITCTISTQKT